MSVSVDDRGRRMESRDGSFLTWLLTIIVLVLPADAAIALDDISFAGHQGAVTMARFSRDGTTITSAGTDQTVRIWDAKTGGELRRYDQHTGPVYCVTVAGRIVVSGAQDNTVRIWDLPLKAPLRTLSTGNTPVYRLALSTDGISLLAAANNKVHLLDARPLKSLVDVTDPAAKTRDMPECRSVTVRGDGNAVAAGSQSGSVRLWNPYLPEHQLEFQAHESSVVGIGFYGTQLLVALAADGNVSTWNLKQMQDQASAEPPSGNDAAQPRPVNTARVHTGRFIDQAFINSGAQFITCGSDGRVVMTDSSNGKTVREFPIGEKSPTAVAVRGDNQRVAVGSESGDVVVWNAGNAEEVLTFKVDAGVTALAFSRDHKLLAVADADRHLSIYGPSLPNRPASELVLHQTIVTTDVADDLVFGSDQRSIWTALRNGEVANWAYASPLQLRQLNTGGAVYGLKAGQDGQLIVSCGADSIVRVWNSESGQQLHQMRGHQGAIHAVDINQQETLAVTSGADGTIRLWDLVGGRQLKQLAKRDSTMYCIAFHPDRKSVAGAGADRQIHLFDLASGDEVATLKGHTDFIHALSYSPSGKKLLSYGYAGTLNTWDTAETRLLTSTQVGHIGNSAVYSPDGSQILLSDGEGRIQVIDSP